MDNTGVTCIHAHASARPKPLLYDVFCGAGGCSAGYAEAGFEVIGVDLHPQPRYPFEFLQMDALQFLTDYIDGKYREAAVIHASPPCLLDSQMSRGRWQKKRLEHPDLIGPVRDLLIETGKPYVIENVAGARHKFASHLMLCGTMFGLQSDYGNELQRHRYFEVFPHVLIMQQPCKHNGRSAIGVYGGGQHPARRTRVNGSGAEQVDDDFGIEQRKKAMGITWMTGTELSQAIPPAYCEFIGRKLLEVIRQ